jgi:hypothetical protein
MIITFVVALPTPLFVFLSQGRANTCLAIERLQ